MPKQRRTFSTEFEVATQVLNQGYSFPQAARSFGIAETIVRRWVKHLKQERSGETFSSKVLTRAEKNPRT